MILYQPRWAKYLEYLIAHECGHIYRFFSARSEDRLLPATDSTGLRTAKEEVAREPWEGRKRIPKRLVDELLGSLCSGLVRQLVNTPPDCRIETWIYEKFESLRDIQASALHELYSTSLRCLDAKMKEWAPPSIYRKSNAMNYVLAKIDGRLLNQPNLIAPYAEQGVAQLGEKLVSYLAEADTGHVGDMRAADAWAKEMSIEGWYRWVKS